LEDFVRIVADPLNGISIKIPDNAVKGLLNNPNVAYIEADTFVEANATPSWGLDRIDERDLPMDGKFVSSFSGRNVHAYVIDSGVRSSHVEFSGRLGNGRNFSGDSNACNDHGTHVAGTLGGTNYGVAPDVTIHDVQVLGCDGRGSKSDVIAGVDWVKANHIKPAVVNMSLGGSISSAENSAVQSLINAGVTVITSAGNENGDACTKSPASVSDALTIGATENDDDRASYSNYGSCLDLFAPGTGINSASNSSNSAATKKSGTSMAAPHVAGVVANYLELNPNSTPNEVHSAIVNNASLNKVNSPGPGSPNLLLYSKLQNSNAPSTPQNFNVQSLYCFGQAVASWSASSGNVSNYEIWASQSSNWSSPSKWYETTGTSRYIESGRSMYLKVRACDGNNCSSFSQSEQLKYYSTCY